MTSQTSAFSPHLLAGLWWCTGDSFAEFEKKGFGLEHQRAEGRWLQFMQVGASQCPSVDHDKSWVRESSVLGKRVVAVESLASSSSQFAFLLFNSTQG